MRREPKTTANVAAATFGVLYIICRIGVVLFSDLAMSVAQSWFHVLELSKGLSMGSFILGLVTSTSSAWLIGYVFANVYDYFVKKVTYTNVATQIFLMSNDIYRKKLPIVDLTALAIFSRTLSEGGIYLAL